VQEQAINWWGFDSLLFRTEHRHTTLNGADFMLLEGDLKLLGATYADMNPHALRFIASLGYNALAFHDGYLDRHPWIRSLPWLEPLDEAREGWHFFRASEQLARMPKATLGQVLAASKPPRAPTVVPPGAWNTGQLDLDRDFAVVTSRPTFLAWTDEHGRRVTRRPVPALYQHIFGPDLPAYAIRAPRNPGRYRLVVLDERMRPIFSQPYLVDAGLRTGRPWLSERPRIATNLLSMEREAVPGDGPRLRLENRTDDYLQANVKRADNLGSARAHPGMLWLEPGSLVLKVRVTPSQSGRPVRETIAFLPHDMLPHSRLEVRLPITPLSSDGPDARLEIWPTFITVADQLRPADQADLRMGLVSDGVLARGPHSSMTK
jgi:hypothetical protein